MQDSVDFTRHLGKYDFPILRTSNISFPTLQYYANSASEGVQTPSWRSAGHSPNNVPSAGWLYLVLHCLQAAFQGPPCCSVCPLQRDTGLFPSTVEFLACWMTGPTYRHRHMVMFTYRYARLLGKQERTLICRARLLCSDTVIIPAVYLQHYSKTALNSWSWIRNCPFLTPVH